MKMASLGILAVILIIALVCGFNIWVGGISVQYLVQYWGTYIQHKPVTVPFLPCAVAGLFVAEISVPFAILTWVLSFVL